MSFNNFDGFNNEQSFTRHLCRFIGQTVIVFTTSGGVSGSGFTGVLLSVNCDTIRIDSRQGFAPACPLENSFSADFNDNDNYGCRGREGDRDYNRDYNRDCNRDCDRDHDRDRDRRRSVGSVCEIPICSIVAFCHNAI